MAVHEEIKKELNVIVQRDIDLHITTLFYNKLLLISLLKVLPFELIT